MIFKSCISRNLDPYRAGVEIAEQLAGIAPEVIFLFSSSHYRGAQELLESLYAELAPCVPNIIGNSADGVYGLDSVAEVGISALAIQSGGKIHCHLVQETGIRDQPYASAQKCLSRVLDACQEKPKLLFLASDFRTDSTQVLRALNDGTDVPIVGGLATDDYSFESCQVFANQNVLSDSIVLLAIEGEIEFDIQLGNSPVAVGKSGTITAQNGTRIQQVDNIPIMEFIERELGKPLDHIDKGILTLRTVNPDQTGEHKVRSMLLPAKEESEPSVLLLGGVEKSEQIQVCTYPPERMLQDVRDIAQRIANSQFKPQAAIIISCAGRKAVLGSAIQQEIQKLRENVPSLQALAGFPSFGEYAPFHRAQHYSPTLFHNMTYVVLLLAGT